MRFKVILPLLMSAAVTGVSAQTAVVTGSVVDADTGAPVSGATVTIPGQNISVVTGPAGDFRISNALPGETVVNVSANGYGNDALQVRLYNGQTTPLDVALATEQAIGEALADEYAMEMAFDESLLEDEEGNSQAVTALSGSNDNIYYKFVRYGLQPLYSNYRGYRQEQQETYINGMLMNDLVRGGFTFSQLGGMTSRAFRNNTATMGLGAAAYGFSAIGGSQNFNTLAENYSPGFNGSLSYTNSNYYARAMATYSTGVNPQGWALTVSAIGRYSDEGIVDGTFYNAAGYFLSLQKILNKNNSLTLTTWGAPMEYANARATVQEAYDLVGSNLYNPSWGWQDGKKRSDNIRRKFDPTVMLNWLYKDEKTTLNTGVAFRWINFARTRLNYFKGNDPKPDYYKNLPSYWEYNQEVPGMAEYYTEMWEHDTDGIRQMNWDRFYQINFLNNQSNIGKPAEDQVGSTYMQQWEHSNQFNFIANSVLNRRLNDNLTLQAGLNFNYTKTADYMTVKDLLGGAYWLDVDPFSDRDINNPLASADIMQNDLNDPNRRVTEGERFGYDYNIHALKATAFLQNQFNSAHWDVNWGLTMSYEQFYRFGHMRNGRAPQNSLGKSKTYHFDNAAAKVGATYKLDGRNFFTIQAQYGTQAPLIKDVYISPRIKDTTVDNLKSQRVFSADASYSWNYRRFRGTVGVFYTDITGAIERMGFYDETLNTFVNFALSDVHRQYKGVELGMAYKILPSLTASVAGTYARYQYKNNPWGTRSAENELSDPQSKQVFLKNYFCSSTPQAAMNIALDYAAPKNWYFNVNATWMGDYYVQLAYPYHEEMPGIWTVANTYEEVEAIVDAFATQEKLPCNWVLNASIGKSIYFNRSLGLNFKLSVSNILNNKNLVTNAFQQSRVDTKKYNPKAYPTKYQYAQGVKVYFNVGVRF